MDPNWPSCNPNFIAYFYRNDTLLEHFYYLHMVNIDDVLLDALKFMNAHSIYKSTNRLKIIGRDKSILDKKVRSELLNVGAGTPSPEQLVNMLYD